MLDEISGCRLPVGTNKLGCRVLLGVAVMCPAGCKRVMRYAAANAHYRLMNFQDENL
jgi:hypothetical protein